MLRSLSIRDFVTVEALDLEFGGGFTVLTGETGAGKSILIDALALVLGERSDPLLVRDGCSRAEIWAEFDLPAGAAVAFLEAADLGAGPGECLLRRLLETGGRTRAYVNGRPCTISQLRELGSLLVDVHGQHEHQWLLRPATQRALLDGYAGGQSLAVQVGAAHRAWRSAVDLRVQRDNDSRSLEREREALQWLVDELTAGGFSAAEWEALPAEHRRQAHLSSLVEAVEAAVELLSEGDQAALGLINAALSRVRTGAGFDTALQAQEQSLASAALEIEEVAYGLRQYRRGLETDPARLQALEQRLGQYHEAARKHRVAPEALSSILAEARERLAGLEQGMDAEALARNETQAQANYLELAGQLGALRAAGAERLGAEVTRSLKQLAMEAASFEVGIEHLAEGGAQGLEAVEFRVVAYAGAQARPLAKVASGGELSRLSLAIQTATSDLVQVPTLIFDEVDSGVGGRVAERVGELLRGLGGAHQVMCITHLAQVAACATAHYQVVKRVESGRPATGVEVLEGEARVEELARMIGGMEITRATREHAAEMLRRAR